MAGWDDVKSTFQKFVLRWEGGYVNHPDDPGGHTNMGVTLRTFQNLAPKLLGIPGTLENLKKLTTEQQYKILKYYWDDVNGDSFTNPYIAAYVTELAWGSGESGAEKKIVSKAVQQFGKSLTVDGVITKADVAVINSIPAAQFFDALTTARLNFYKSLSTWPVFGKGWSNRINDFVNTFKKKAQTIA